MPKVKILDCTLRDGGYINNWKFGAGTIRKIIQKLSVSNVETIECGFLSQTQKIEVGKCIFRTIEDAECIFCNISGNLALMINCGEYAANDISDYCGGNIKTLRIAFHKHQRNEAQELCSALKGKGYTVFFQPMVTMGYTDRELLELIDWANNNQPDAFYIVDSFGTMRKNDVLRIFYLIDNNLDFTIKVGFHSHNNLQLSFSNAQELIQLNVKRDVIIDTSVFGMGRGAGNLCTELLTQYINENIDNKYDLIPILEIMDECIMPIYTKLPWGYSAPYYIAAINNCHPNYATYLVNKQTICVRDINTIIKNIPDGKKHLYDNELITGLYIKYQHHNVDDSETIGEISQLCKDRRVLLLAPGRSLKEFCKEIESYIAENRDNLVIISVNHIPDKLAYDRVFISNLKRFQNIDDAVRRISSKIICTSNISTSTDVSVVNYASYLNDDGIINDNAGLMLINVLRKAGVKAFALAGFDGFNLTNNYCDDRMITGTDFEKQVVMNKSVTVYFNKMKKNYSIQFVTPTIYNGDVL